MATLNQTPMDASIQIRDATVDDLDSIVDFNRRMAEETEGRNLSPSVLAAGVRAVLSSVAHGRYFVACRNSRVIGQLMITTEWSDWRNGPIWWIQSVYVHPEHRRRGVFRSLYRHAESVARATSGVVGLRLYVEHNNSIAQRVYEKLGMHGAGYVVFENIWCT